MADSYHYHQKIIKRSEGRSAVACAAYRSGERLHDEREGRTMSFGDPGRVVECGIELAPGMPEGLLDREALWNSVEAAEKARNAQLAREHEMSIPRDLPHDARIALARDYARELAAEGHAVDWAIHRDREGGGYHVHMMEALREWDAAKDGWASKTSTEYLVRDRDGNDRYMGPDELRGRAGEGWEKLYRYKTGDGRELLTKGEAEGRGLGNSDRESRKPESRVISREDWDGRTERILELRERWQDRANDALGRHYDRMHTPEDERQRIDCRSYEERDGGRDDDLVRQPTRHMGPDRTYAEEQEKERCARSGEEYRPVTEAGRENARISEQNQVRESVQRALDRAREILRDIEDRLRGIDRAAEEVARRIERYEGLKERSAAEGDRGNNSERNRLDTAAYRCFRGAERALDRMPAGRQRDEAEDRLRLVARGRSDKRCVDLHDRKADLRDERERRPGRFERMEARGSDRAAMEAAREHVRAGLAYDRER